MTLQEFAWVLSGGAKAFSTLSRHGLVADDRRKMKALEKSCEKPLPVELPAMNELTPAPFFFQRGWG